MMAAPDAHGFNWTGAGVVLAIAQYWVPILYNRFCRRGNITSYPTAKIEIGYSQLGPTLGLVGTLRAERREFFVSSISLSVVRLKDRLTHDFKWLLFRPNRMPVGPRASEQLTLEIASGFMVSPQEPRAFHILFADVATQETMLSSIEACQSAVADARGKLEQEGRDLRVVQLAPLQHFKWEQDIQALYEADERKHAAWRALDDLFYWQAGDYGLSLTIQTSGPERTFTQSWPFELSGQDFSRLRLNVISILDVALTQEAGLPEPTSFFVTADYQSEDVQAAG